MGRDIQLFQCSIAPPIPCREETVCVGLGGADVGVRTQCGKSNYLIK